jgi:hypothetical protein
MNNYIKPDRNIIIRNRPFDRNISDIFEYHEIKIKSVEELLLLIQGKYTTLKKEIKINKEKDELKIIDLKEIFLLFNEMVNKTKIILNKFITLYNEIFEDKNGKSWNIPLVEINIIELSNYKLGMFKPTLEILKYIRDYACFLYKSLEDIIIDPYEIYGIKK